MAHNAATDISEIEQGWLAFCKAEDYDPANTALRVAYGCGFQDGSWAERLNPSERE